MEELKKYVLYFIIAAAFAMLFYLPPLKVGRVALPTFALWMLWQNIGYWSYSVAVMVIFVAMFLSSDIYAYSFKTLKRPMWVYVLEMNLCILITVFYASWFFSYNPPRFLYGYYNKGKRYAMLVVCFIAAWVLIDFFIFYLLAPVLTKKQITQRGRLTNYRVIGYAELMRRGRLSQKTAFANKRYSIKISGRLRIVGKRPIKIESAGKQLVLSVPLIRTAGITFANGKTVFKVSPSQLARFQSKVGIVYSYDKCVSVFGLEYIKDVKELGSAKTGVPSRWDRCNHR